jgi:outer membrane receptor protein involved in Fe transport
VLFPQDTRLNNSPELTGSFLGEYRFPLGLANLGGVIGASVNYSSEKTLRSLTNNVITESESDSILQAVARLGVESDRWTAELYAENLFNEDGSVTAPDLGGAFNTVRLRPRTIGIQATFKF